MKVINKWIFLCPFGFLAIIDCFGIDGDVLAHLEPNALNAKELETRFNQEERESLIATLREWIADESAIRTAGFLDDIRIVAAIANLGDARAMEELYRFYHFGRAAPVQRHQAFFSVSHPRFLVILAADLVDPAGGPQNVERDIYPAPVINALGFEKILLRSGYFSSEVEDWARRVQADYRFTRPRQYPVREMQEFWHLNEESLRRADYEHLRLPIIRDMSDYRSLPMRRGGGLEPDWEQGSIHGNYRDATQGEGPHAGETMELETVLSDQATAPESRIWFWWLAVIGLIMFSILGGRRVFGSRDSS